MAPQSSRRCPPRPGEAAPDPRDLTRRIARRAVRDFALVRKALGDLPAGALIGRDEVLAELETHAWVQAKVDGVWMDLDPSLADAAPGKKYCEPTWVGDAIPRDVFQEVTIRVKMETLAAKEARKQTVLEVTIPAADLIDKQVFLVHSRPGGALGGVGSTVAAKAKDIWSPSLWIDGQISHGKAIDFSETAASANESVLDALSTDSPENAPVFVAEWLELEFTAPGGRQEVNTRVLTDRAGAA